MNSGDIVGMKRRKSKKDDDGEQEKPSCHLSVIERIGLIIIFFFLFIKFH